MASAAPAVTGTSAEVVTTPVAAAMTADAVLAVGASAIALAEKANFLTATPTAESGDGK